MALAAGCLRVVVTETPWYKRGPGQVEPPDGFLKRGHHVFVLGERDSYARFIDPNFLAGSVFSGDLITPGEWKKVRDEPPEEIVIPPGYERIQGVGVAP